MTQKQFVYHSERGIETLDLSAPSVAMPSGSQSPTDFQVLRRLSYARFPHIMVDQPDARCPSDTCERLLGTCEACPQGRSNAVWADRCRECGQTIVFVCACGEQRFQADEDSGGGGSTVVKAHSCILYPQSRKSVLGKCSYRHGENLKYGASVNS